MRVGEGRDRVVEVGVVVCMIWLGRWDTELSVFFFGWDEEKNENGLACVGGLRYTRTYTQVQHRRSNVAANGPFSPRRLSCDVGIDKGQGFGGRRAIGNLGHGWEL